MALKGADLRCPNCREYKATCQFKDNEASDLYIICTGCGLHAYASKREWVFEKSFIEGTLIGMDKDSISIDTDEIDQHEDEGALPFAFQMELDI